MLSSIRDCFVTGRWEEGRDAATLLKEDGKETRSLKVRPQVLRTSHAKKRLKPAALDPSLFLVVGFCSVKTVVLFQRSCSETSRIWKQDKSTRTRPDRIRLRYRSVQLRRCLFV